MLLLPSLSFPPAVLEPWAPAELGFSRCSGLLEGPCCSKQLDLAPGGFLDQFLLPKLPQKFDIFRKVQPHKIDVTAAVGKQTFGAGPGKLGAERAARAS